MVKKKTNHIRDSPHMAIKIKPGGIAIIVTNTLSHKVTKSGHDSEGLGGVSHNHRRKKSKQGLDHKCI